jgi:hypothetical protein
LEFRRGGWQEDEVDAVRDGQLPRRVPACPIEHQHGAMQGVDPCVGSERG